MSRGEIRSKFRVQGFDCFVGRDKNLVREGVWDGGEIGSSLENYEGPL